MGSVQSLPARSLFSWFRELRDRGMGDLPESWHDLRKSDKRDTDYVAELALVTAANRHFGTTATTMPGLMEALRSRDGRKR